VIDTSAVYPLLIGWNEFVNQSDEPTLIKRIDLIKLIVALFKKFLDTLHTFKKALTKKGVILFTALLAKMQALHYICPKS
jgi:hypothetical protein